MMIFIESSCFMLTMIPILKKCVAFMALTSYAKEVDVLKTDMAMGVYAAGGYEFHSSEKNTTSPFS